MEILFNKLNEIINKYDSIIIMGHKDPDIDSVGSSLGLYEIVEHFNKNAYLFFNNKKFEDYNTNISQAFMKMKKKIVCVDENSYKKVPGNVLLIITDVHIKDRLELPDLADKYDVVVLDHHLKSKDYIKNTKFFYNDANLSSMSELITYYIEFLNIEIDPVIATTLLAGIEIDTNGFNLKTEAKTYEAASILMELGADSILKQEILKESKEEYIKRANSIKNSFMLNEKMAMCIINSKVTSLELAATAEELLTFEGVEASFIIGLLDDNIIGVSARSLGKIDVSIILEALGGGGHSYNAAAQIKNKTLKEVKQDIIDIININD